MAILRRGDRALESRPRKRAAFAIAAALLGGCAELPEPAAVDLLDQRTGVTWTVTGEPLVLARARTDVAANARDYATLVAVEADRAGKFTSYLIVYRWSTVDRRMVGDADRESGSLSIVADGREIAVQPGAELPKEIPGGESALFRPRAAHVSRYSYAVDLGTLAYIAACHELVVRFPDDSVALPYAIWKDGRKALGEFAARNRLTGTRRSK